MFGKKSDNKLCPLLNKPCVGSECMWATKVRGTNPNTGAEIDNEACAIVWLPTLLMENTKAGIETGKAVEDFRNKMVETQTATLFVGGRTPPLQGH